VCSSAQAVRGLTLNTRLVHQAPGAAPLLGKDKSACLMSVDEIQVAGADTIAQLTCRVTKVRGCRRPAAVWELVEAGAAINTKTRDGRTPLHLASSVSNIAAMRTLIAARADVTAVCRRGRTALPLAAGTDHQHAA